MTNINPVTYLISVMSIDIVMMTLDMQNPALTYVWFFTLTDITLHTLFILLYVVSSYIDNYIHQAQRQNRPVVNRKKLKDVIDLFTLVSYSSLVFSFIFKGVSIPIGFWHMGITEICLATVIYLTVNIVVTYKLVVELWFNDRGAHG